MNIRLPLIVAVVFLLLISARQKELVPSYQITRSVQDPSLKTTEAVFEITFSGIDGVWINPQPVTISCNGVVQKIKPNGKSALSINVEPGKYTFKFFLNENFIEIITDSISIKPGYRSRMSVNFQSSKMPLIVFKPVIYVYPQHETQVKVKLNLKGKLDFTYPEYEDGWAFLANPDGTIEIANKNYHYLFWDGSLDFNFNEINLHEGFVVNQSDLVSFFEEKLRKMGLNSQEIQDYITFWCPLMSKYENSYVHFMFNEEYAEYAELSVNPKPDNIFRVFMIWSEIKDDENIHFEEQAIESFTREGFTVVEWGGSQIEDISGRISDLVSK